MRVIDLSRLTGIDQHALSKLYHENAKGLTIDTLDKICTALNCQVSDLLEYVKKEEQKSQTL